MMQSPLIIALDYPDAQSALHMARQLDPSYCRVKVGKQLFTSAGPDFIEELHNLGFQVFLDLKFHDIPNTVAGAVKAAADLGVWMVNVHAQGGAKMLHAAADAVSGSSDPPILIAVTVLTSMSSDDLLQIGYQISLEQLVVKLARMSRDMGLSGVVCSAQEAAVLRDALDDDAVLVTPGIRMQDDVSGDQTRIMTPSQAIKETANYLVMGRPVTGHKEPARRVQEILQSIQVN